MLIARCDEDGRLEMYLAGDRVLDSYRDAVSVRLRWDNDPVEEQEWGIGDGMRSVFAPRAEAFVAELMRRRELVIRLPVYSEGYVTAVYRIPPLPAPALTAFVRQCKLAVPAQVPQRDESARKWVAPLDSQRQRARLDSLRRLERRDRARLDGILQRDSSAQDVVVVRDTSGTEYTLPKHLKAGGDDDMIDQLADFSALDFAIYRGRQWMTSRELVHARWALATLRCRGVHGLVRSGADSTGIALLCSTGLVPITAPSHPVR